MGLKAVASSSADAAGITALTGDVTATGPGSVAATLATAQPNAHTWAAAQTFTAAPVFSDASGSRTALGVPAYTAPTSWTPADGSGAALSFTGVSANYIQIGNMVFAYASLTYPSTVSGSSAVISGLPVTVANAQYARQCIISYTTVATLAHMLPTANATTISLLTNVGGAITNANMSTTQLIFMAIYPAT